MQNLEPFPQPVPEPESQPEPLAVLIPGQSSSSAPPTAPPARATEQLMFKNRLQEYTQRATIPLPVYTTVNEGQQVHAPKFRSTVLVDGESFVSGNTFSVRKAAEQDAARVALESITKKIKNESCPLVTEDKLLCKSILHEFAVKMNLEKPIYDISRPKGQLPVFKCSVAFNGATYTGETGRTKKEAEQLGARAAILSILGDSRYGTFLTEIIKSKSKLYAALYDDNNSDIVSNVVNDTVPKSSTIEQTLGQQPPHHEFKVPKPEPSSVNVALPIIFVPQEQPLGNCQDVPQGKPIMGDGQDSLKRLSKSSRRKNNKKMRIDPRFQVGVAPVNLAPACSVAPVNQAPASSVAPPVNQAPACLVTPVNQAPACSVPPVNQAPAFPVAPVNQAPACSVALVNQPPAYMVAPVNQAPTGLVTPTNQEPTCSAVPVLADGQVSLNRRRKNKKKNKKKMQTDPLMPTVLAPVNQAPTYSVAPANQEPACIVAAVNQAPACSVTQ